MFFRFHHEVKASQKNNFFCHCSHFIFINRNKKKADSQKITCYCSLNSKMIIFLYNQYSDQCRKKEKEPVLIITIACKDAIVCRYNN